jgi:hypothetical protein
MIFSNVLFPYLIMKKIRFFVPNFKRFHAQKATSFDLIFAILQIMRMSYHTPDVQKTGGFF